MPWTGDLSNDREVLSFELTMPLIRQHLSLYATVIRTLLADPALHQRVFEAQIGTRTLKAMETAYANEPVLTAVLGNAGVTVHQYVITTAALAMVAGTMDNTLHPLLARRGTVPANVALVRANQSEINELVTSVEALESQIFARHPPAPAR